MRPLTVASRNVRIWTLTREMRAWTPKRNASAKPFAGAILTALQAIPHPLPFPLDKVVGRLKEGMGADATHRIRVMLRLPRAIGQQTGHYIAAGVRESIKDDFSVPLGKAVDGPNRKTQLCL